MDAETRDPGILVRHAQGGDVAAREALARAWLPSAYGAALAALGRAADAEDAAQEAFLRAFSALGTLKDPSRFGPWLLAIVRNAARDLQRRKAVTPRTEGVLAGDPPSRLAASVPDERAEAWRRLPEDERLVTWLKASEGITFREIADLLGTSKSAVNRTWRRALARLRTEATRC
jgi:RNA polymerase sigma-70 factor (ECF subfamily)